jgi:LSD1 subclass zinc finger protein
MAKPAPAAQKRAVPRPVFSSRSLAKKTSRGYLSSFREIGFCARIASSMVEQETLNLLVVGSSPTRCSFCQLTNLPGNTPHRRKHVLCAPTKETVASR